MLAPYLAHGVRLAGLLVVMVACGRPATLTRTDVAPSPIGPDSFHVAFRTNRGQFIVGFHRDWSPLASDRVYDLVRRGIYDDIRIFRVVQNFVAQFGLTGDSATNRAWQAQGIDDEPVKVPNRQRTVSFARGGARTRSMQLFINLRDNTPRLDTLPAGGVVGYPPLGEVIAGWEVVELLNAEYGNAPSQAQDSIARQGNAYLDRTYPHLSRIQEVRVVKKWQTSRTP